MMLPVIFIIKAKKYVRQNNNHFEIHELRMSKIMHKFELIPNFKLLSEH